MCFLCCPERQVWGPQAHYTISLHYTMFPAAFNPVIEMLFFPICIDKSRLVESTKMNIITCMCI